MGQRPPGITFRDRRLAPLRQRGHRLFLQLLRNLHRFLEPGDFGFAGPGLLGGLLRCPVCLRPARVDELALGKTNPVGKRPVPLRCPRLAA